MKLDALVLKRLDELIAKGESIVQTKEFDVVDDKGKKYFNVYSPEVKGWATSVLNLL